MSATFKCTWPMRTPGLIVASAAVASGAILVCVAMMLLLCRRARPLEFLFEHDLIRKPDSTFRDHALAARIRPVAGAIALVVEELAHALGAAAFFVLEAHLLALGLQIIGRLLVGYGAHVLHRELGGFQHFGIELHQAPRQRDRLL